MIIDFRREKPPTSPLLIKNEAVEIVESFKFLGSIIMNNLKWEANTTAIRKKAQQRTYFLRQLKKFKVNQKILVQFYRATIESVLTGSITTWYGNTTQQEKLELDRVVKTARKIIGCDLPPLEQLYTKRVLRKARAIVADDQHPAYHLFVPLPSGRRFRCIRAKTERLRKSFFPQAVQAVSPHDL